MKLLFRIFLSLSFFLLSGYSYTQANSHRDNDFCFRKVFETQAATLNARATAISYSTSLAEERFDKIYAEECEDEVHDLVYFKKYNGALNYFTAYYTPTADYFYRNTIRCLPYREHFSYFFSNRYIAIRSIRV